MEYNEFVEFVRRNETSLRYSTVEALADDLGFNLPTLLEDVRNA